MKQNLKKINDQKLQENKNTIVLRNKVTFYKTQDLRFSSFTMQRAAYFEYMYKETYIELDITA